MMTHFYLSVPVSDESNEDPETEAAKRDSAITDFIIYTCAIPTVTCQNVFHGKAPKANTKAITVCFLRFLLM